MTVFVGHASDAPTTGQTRVRLRDGCDHRTHAPGVPKTGDPTHRPEWITILLPPLAASAKWTCGTPLVWRIAQETLREVGVVPAYGVPCVCVHMIEID